MASVAICPHCYLQLIVPDGIEPEDAVECPTCAKEFGLDQAVLRVIPEVIRRPRRAAADEALTAPSSLDELPAEQKVLEIDELVMEADAGSESAVIEKIKARIDAEIGAGGLPPGAYSMPLGVSFTEDQGGLLPAIEPAEEDAAAWFCQADTVPEVTPVDELDAELDLADELSDAAVTDEAKAPATGNAELQLEKDAPSAPAEFPDDSRSSSPVESAAASPPARTLADWMPPRAEQDMAEPHESPRDDEPGPTFDLPNVPLTPPLGATVEIDLGESLGPAAETEFELDDVDFETTPDDEPSDDERMEELATADLPVFSEPAAAAVDAPFVLPRVPQPRKKRSAVRTLVGVAAGGVGGTIAAWYVLLWLLGPEGDFLQVAKYLPSAMLPKSFHVNRAQVVSAMPSAPVPQVKVAGSETESPATMESAPTETPGDEETANVPAAYTVESESSAEIPVPRESADDNRYGAAPAPLDEPAAEPIANEPHQATSAATLPLKGPTFTAAQLAAALDAGRAAQNSLIVGDLSDATVRRTKGMGYAKLCDLAEALTFVDPAAPSTDVDEATQATDQLFRATLADPHTRSEVDRIAQIWIDSPHRTHGGIFLAGALSGGRIAGDVYEYEFTDEGGHRLTLLTHEPVDPLAEGSAHPVAIVGSIVDHPSDQVVGYRGTAERAIWVTRAIPLD